MWVSRALATLQDVRVEDTDNGSSEELPTLFHIGDSGSLALDNVTITGSQVGTRDVNLHPDTSATRGVLYTDIPRTRLLILGADTASGPDTQPLAKVPVTFDTPRPTSPRFLELQEVRRCDCVRQQRVLVFLNTSSAARVPLHRLSMQLPAYALLKRSEPRKRATAL